MSQSDFTKLKMWLTGAFVSILVAVGGMSFGIQKFFVSESAKYSQSVQLTRQEHHAILEELDYLHDKILHIEYLLEDLEQ